MTSTITPTALPHILRPPQLAVHLAAGNIRVQTHPDDPRWMIYNYTELAQFGRLWDDCTLTCRGLIVHSPDGRILARPFRKFFNLSELDDEQAGRLVASGGPVEVWEKLDGSLGIYYPAPDGLPAIATRGSFASPQAIHATELLRTRYPSYRAPDGATVLFEIIYPQNRIVLDYAGLDDLVLLGAVDIATGATLPFDQARDGWPGPVVARHPFTTLAEALAAPERDGYEGYVIRFTGADTRVKVKHSEYVRLHKIVTGLSERGVWEALGSDAGPLSARLDKVPDEFHEWVRAVEERLTAEIADRVDTARVVYTEILERTGLEPDRKTFALAAKDITDLAPYLFALYDGQDDRARGIAYKAVRPAGHIPYAAGVDA